MLRDFVVNDVPENVGSREHVEARFSGLTDEQKETLREGAKKFAETFRTSEGETLGEEPTEALDESAIKSTNLSGSKKSED